MTKPMGAKRRSVAAHSASHPGMRGPLNLLMGENWLVWHFWNPSQLTYQMAVSELFTNATFADDPDDDPFSLMIGGGPSYSKRENGFDGFRHAPGSMGFVTPRVRWVSSRPGFDGFRHAPGSMGFVTAHVPAVEGTDEALAKPYACVHPEETLLSGLF